MNRNERQPITWLALVAVVRVLTGNNKILDETGQARVQFRVQFCDFRRVARSACVQTAHSLICQEPLQL